MEGLLDKRLGQRAGRCAPVDEVLALRDRYRTGHRGWTVKHFYAWYRRDGGAQLYLGEEPVTGGAVAGDAAAPGRESARVGARSDVGSDCHDGRCDQ